MNSRTKGKVGEREWAQVLRDNGWAARRGQQFAGGQDSPDVIAHDLPFHFEVKRVEKLNLYDAVAQAEGDSKGKPWVVAHRRNHAPWLVTVKAELFFTMLRDMTGVQPNQQQTTGDANDTASETGHGLRATPGGNPPGRVC